MPEKILYYLGAGASVNCLPLAKSVMDLNFPDGIKIRGLIDSLRTFNSAHLDKYRDTDSIEKYLDSIAIEFKELADQADVFGDIDTYAKYLYLMGKTADFKKLKCSLAHFFSIK